MSTEPITKALMKDWVKRRADAVREKYSSYDSLIEIGVEGISDPETPTSVFCPFHTNVNTTAARYYPPEGRKHGYLHCYACHNSWDAISAFATAHGGRFMDALVVLERRFRIQVPQRPELPDWIEPTERGANYESEQWKDIPRVLALLEAKLMRVKPKCTLLEFTKLCRVIDNVHFDIEKDPKATPAMIEVTGKAIKMMDDISSIYDMSEEIAANESANPL